MGNFFVIFKENEVYLGNGTREALLIGSHRSPIDPCRLRWS